MKTKPEDSNERLIEYIARQAARHHGAIKPDLPGRVRRNVKRNFGVSLTVEDVTSRLDHNKTVYLVAAGILHDDLAAWEKDLADDGEAGHRRFMQAIAQKCTGEFESVLNTIARYAVYYEIMRGSGGSLAYMSRPHGTCCGWQDS